MATGIARCHKQQIGHNHKQSHILQPNSPNKHKVYSIFRCTYRGHDATSWINRCLDCFSEGLSFRRQSKKPKMKVHYGDKAKDYDYNARKKQQSEEIDRILDKLKKSGYNSLTTEEKKSLFDASKK